MFKFVSMLAVARLIEALRHNPEGRGFDSRLCHWNFSLWPSGVKASGA